MGRLRPGEGNTHPRGSEIGFHSTNADTFSFPFCFLGKSGGRRGGGVLPPDSALPGVLTSLPLASPWAPRCGFPPERTRVEGPQTGAPGQGFPPRGRAPRSPTSPWGRGHLLAHSGPLRPPRLERGCLLVSQAHGQYLPNRGSMSSAVLWCQSQVSSSAGQRWWPCPSYPSALLPETVGLSHALDLFAGASPVCRQRLRREDRGGPVSRAPTYLSSQAGPS